ncbi:hypothetical protein CDAR_220421 [Caerostris darwini]|uniref:Uncharacterized protein n=1 Tax=Caerostris darwini TaxID=1538125 RepID=A0AAV4UG57_9ARAC|nr:hypothetical protein CDAR_220421 [Caerostris darwini]
MPVPAHGTSANISTVTSALRVSLQYTALFNTDSLHSFDLQRLQLLPPDYQLACVHFAQWCPVLQSARDMIFPAYALFSDEVIFDSNGVCNQHNAYLWTEENSQGVPEPCGIAALRNKSVGRFCLLLTTTFYQPS